MKAIVYERYGPPEEVLETREVDAPTAGHGEVLVRVRAAGVGAGDWHMLVAEMFAVRLYQGLFRPKRRVLGHEAAGVVEAVGAGVTRWKPGDEVFGETPAGAFAELVRVREDRLARKPAGVRFEEAAAVPVSALTALQGLRDKGGLKEGMKVLVNGASGGVGTFAVQIAKAMGAEVTGTCSAAKAKAVRALGADRVLDRRSEDFTTRDERYDLILDCAGKQPVAACTGALAEGGTYVTAGGAPGRSLWIALTGGRRAVAYIAKPNAKDLETLAGMLEAGTIRPRIDRTYPLGDVPKALRRLGDGEVTGKMVVRVVGLT